MENSTNTHQLNLNSLQFVKDTHVSLKDTFKALESAGVADKPSYNKIKACVAVNLLCESLVKLDALIGTTEYELEEHKAALQEKEAERDDFQPCDYTDDVESSHEDWLDENHDEITIANRTFTPSYVLKELDDVAYSQSLNDYAYMLFESDPTYFDSYSQIIEEIEYGLAEIEKLEEKLEEYNDHRERILEFLNEYMEEPTFSSVFLKSLDNMQAFMH
jgi:hypothetical protein